MISSLTIRLPALAAAGLVMSACGGGDGDPAERDAGDGANGDSTLPALSIAAARLAEGDAAAAKLIFAVTLSEPIGLPVSVGFSTADATADQTDYAALAGRLDIAAGDTDGTIAVEIFGDTQIETDEEFTIALSDPVNATIADGIAVGTIVNDDFPRLGISSPAIDEGDSGPVVLTFDVNLDVAAVGDVTVDYATSNVVATAGADYAAANGTLTIPEGDTAATIDVVVNGDTDIELDEQFVVNLLNASANARIAVDEGTGLIVNDDFPKLTIGSGSVTEADVGSRALTLSLSLDAAAYEDLVISYETSDGSATAGTDYLAASASVTIPAGDTSASIAIETLGDTDVEGDETFSVTITDLRGGALLALDTATGTIFDNDLANPGATLSGSSVSVGEGDAGASTLSFLLSLDRPMTEDVTFDFETVDGTAVSPDDYAAVSGTATIPAGSVRLTLDVSIAGDTDEESDETFSVLLSNPSAGVSIVTPQLTGTILDDDAPDSSLPMLRIASASQTEGDSGATDMIFAVTLSSAAATVVTVDYATTPISATADVDYTSVAGTLTIAAGRTDAAINVPVIGDTFTEDNETFRVTLGNLTGEATLGGNAAIGTILTDEPISRVSIGDASMLEGDSGTSDLVFTVRADVASIDPISFDFASAQGTAVDGEDFIGISGTGRILAGETDATIAVPVIGDTDNEPDEDFTLTLDNLSLNATFADASATGILTNDDGSPGWQSPQILGEGREPSLDMDALGNGAAIWTNLSPIPDVINAAVFAGGAWQDVTVVAQVSSFQFEPAIAMTDGGNAVAAWRDVTLQAGVYTAGAGWAESQVIDGINFYPQVAGNENGDAVAAWQRAPENSGRYFDSWRAMFDAATDAFEPAELFEFDDSGFNAPPFVALDAQGNAMIVWDQDYSDPALSGIYFDYYDAAVGAWTSASRIPGSDGSAVSDLVMRSDGRAVLALDASGFPADSVEVWLYDPVSSQWAATGPVETASDLTAWQGKVALGANGDIFAAWLQASPLPGVDWDVWANRYDATAGAWGPPVAIENGAGTALASPRDAIDIAADAAGNAIVVWSQEIDAATDLVLRIRAARYSVADAAWGPAEQIDEDDYAVRAVDPRIAMDDNGNAIVVWESERDTGGFFPTHEVGAARYVAP